MIRDWSRVKVPEETLWLLFKPKQIKNQRFSRKHWNYVYQQIIWLWNWKFSKGEHLKLLTILDKKLWNRRRIYDNIQQLDLTYSCVPIIITFSLFTGELESAKLHIFISSKQYLLHVGTSTLIDHKRSQKLTLTKLSEKWKIFKVHMVALVMWFMALVDYHT